MRFIVLMCSFGCLVEEPAPPEPAARIVASWDPLACSDHRQRVVVELESEEGLDVSSSAACTIGRLTIETPTWGFYRGRIYTWVLDRPIRSVAPVTLAIDAPVVYWQLSTPP